ncbi:MAG TPA: nuclear transport factor 2 family protein [Pyrinomonadaceae bacterium]|nr:nuclear transport factor 2 family protein [Pyrinomonadaceae bacterium]
MKLRFFLLSAILLTLSTAAFAQAESKNDTELKALVQRMVGAQMAFDEKSLDAIFTADYIEVSPLGEVDPREKVLGFYKKELAPPGGKMEGIADLSEYSIRGDGKTAIVIVKETFLPTPDAKVSSSRSLRVMLVCRRENGIWKIASAQYTGIRPKQPAPAPKTN